MKRTEACKYTGLNRDCTGIICKKAHPNSPISEELCNSCQAFQSRYIEFPITVSNINLPPSDGDLYKKSIGSIVRVSPCGEEYKGKSFYGILLGELPYFPTVSFKHNELTFKMLPNPAIFVPELKKIIYGAESWWERVGAGKVDEDIKKCMLAYLFP